MKFIGGLLLFLCTYSLVGNKIVYIVPPGGYEGGKLFEQGEVWINRDQVNKIWVDLRDSFKKLGYDLQTANVGQRMDDGEAILSCGITPKITQSLKSYKGRVPLIALLWEPYATQPTSYQTQYTSLFDMVFTMYDESVDNGQFHKLHYAQPTLNMTMGKQFDNRSFCTLIAGNKQSGYGGSLYKERRKAIRFFSKSNQRDFAFYGKGWDRQYWPNYGGGITRKADVLSSYKYCICFENTADAPGYITEKIFDVMLAGCIPVYWGAPNIQAYIPSNCFIDFRDFDCNYEKLEQYLNSISEDQFKEYQQNIADYLSSEAAFKFSSEYFVDTIISAVVGVYDRNIVFEEEVVNKLSNMD